MTHYTTLIDAAVLHANLARPDRPTLLDCRAVLGNPDAGPAAWAQGHLPGAIHANLETQLAHPPHSEPGNTGGRHPLPDRLQLAAQCGAWGISNDTQVVAYDDAGGAYAARAWWLLRWLGHTKVAVLNGGITAWTALQGTTLVTETTETPIAATFVARDPLTRIATLTEVTAVVAATAAGASANSLPNPATTSAATISEPRPTLIDARARERFDGKVEPIDPVAGHIPSAVCLPHTGNLDAHGYFLTSERLAERFQSLGNIDDLICYCGSGVTAAHNVLALRHAGLPEPRLYVGSFSEWSADPARPIG